MAVAAGGQPEPLHLSSIMPFCENSVKPHDSETSRWRGGIETLGHSRRSRRPIAGEPRFAGNRSNSAVFAPSWRGAARQRSSTIPAVNDPQGRQSPATIRQLETRSLTSRVENEALLLN